MLTAAEREEGRLKMEIKRLNQEKEELKERRNNFEVSKMYLLAEKHC